MDDNDTIIGIDLGTTNSVVAFVRNGEPHVIEEEGTGILPSVVGLDEEERFLVGTPAQNQAILAPDRTVRSVKRKMGSTETICLGQQRLSPQEVSAVILRKLKTRAEQHLGHPVEKAVITVPAFFNEVQREATREAGELAGLNVVRIINEPTAAALTYKAHPRDCERLLVYDLGGGTFDVSIVQIEAGVVEVLASHGDTQLGGDDFDQLLLDRLCGEFKAKHKVDLRDDLRARSRLRDAVEEAKKTLSAEETAAVQEEFIAERKNVPLNLDWQISRSDYEAMIEPLLAKTLRCVDEALTDAKLKAAEIDKIVLVGGSSRTPRVHELLEGRLDQKVDLSVDPDMCVALGAAIQGALITGVDVGPVLVDITPHTLGIRCLADYRGMAVPDFFSEIIPRNTALPATRTKTYYTHIDGQEAASITVFQGENERASLNDHVGEFCLEDLTDVDAGNEILVRFALDLDGILKVTATERATGHEKRLTLQNALAKYRAAQKDQPANRLDEAFEASGLGAAVSATDDDDAIDSDLSPELREKLEKARDLIGRGKDLAESADDEDASELEALLEKLQSAVETRSEDDIDAITDEVDDLVFYLQDA